MRGAARWALKPAAARKRSGKPGNSPTPSRTSVRETEAARANELYRAAEHGDIHAVLQWTNDPRRPKLRLLLHALLRHKPLEETVFLHVLRWCPQAAQAPNHDGWYPLHLLCHLTARPTPLMLRALCAAGPIAAKMPTSTGWIPLQLLCQQAFARGKARATPATIAAVRQARPDGAQTFLPDGAEWGDRLPVELLPKELPALELCKQRMTCSDDQLRTFAAQHRSLDLKVRGAYRRRCEEACSNGAVFGVVEVIQSCTRRQVSSRTRPTRTRAASCCTTSSRGAARRSTGGRWVFV